MIDHVGDGKPYRWKVHDMAYCSYCPLFYSEQDSDYAGECTPPTRKRLKIKHKVPSAPLQRQSVSDDDASEDSVRPASTDDIEGETIPFKKSYEATFEDLLSVLSGKFPDDGSRPVLISNEKLKKLLMTNLGEII